jgi:hypothetical protein
MYRFLLLCLLLLPATTEAKPKAVKEKELNDNAYRSSKNPYYWKNRRPDSAYWQQDVHYAIRAAMDEADHRIDGEQSLEYWNNSPDTLRFVYFHLFQNAFIKGSHLHELEANNKIKTRLGKKEAEGKGIVIESMTSEKQALTVELDNTIMKVYLPQPLLPGAKTRFDIVFKTYYDRGATRRRMQLYDAWGFMHYNGVQWFPKICVYDRKFGWDTYQHLNKEFYSDFGSYDVSLDFPSNYVLEATGMIQNRDEVLPKELREKLDVKNFANKPWNEKPSVITEYKKGERKTWKYHADNVHDFAFTADPSYRISTEYWNGIECVGIVQEPHASGWQKSGELVAKIIKTFSEDIGMYAYPKMVAADANDGMEYPMLTLDGGRAPGYNGLLVHEIGHNWFYGMVGSNETYRAAMDEGFTQFLTAWGLSRIDGKVAAPAKGKSKWRNRFAEETDATDKSVFNAYHYDALNKEEVPLNTHSDDFNGALGHGGGYRQVYYKTASMLYNLQYTLGDSLFSAAMKHYFNQWKIAHPYYEDFKSSIIQFTHVDLNWFFDQWFETTKTANYSVGRIRNLSGTGNYEILFKRKGEMQMPLDFTVTAKDGKQYDFSIPNTWFAKKTEATTLPKWYGWDKLHPSYAATVFIPKGIRSVQIDTSNRLVDVNMMDNYKTRGLPLSPKAVKVKIDGGVANPWDRQHYRLYVRPDLWWNAVDGVKAGVHFEGDYLFSLHKLDATIWWNTHAGQLDRYLVYTNQGWYDHYAPVNYSFNYMTPLSLANPKLQLLINSRFLDGLWYHRGGFSWAVNRNNVVELSGQTMWRPLSYDKDYLLFPHEWSSRKALANSSLNASWLHTYTCRNGNGSYKVSVRAPLITGNSPEAFNYGYAQLEAINSKRFGKFELRTRLFGRYGVGNNVPYESALFAAGANPEEMMENKYTRSVGLVPTEWTSDVSRYNTNHFQYGGGLNLRGYTGYFMADERDAEVLIAYKGRGGAALNAELDFGNYMKLRPKFTRNWLSAAMYLFADAGIMQLSRYDSLATYWNAKPTNMLSDVRVDAGIGVALTIRKWGVFDKAKPLTLRFDMPLFLNRPPYANPQYFDLRYVVGVSRCF